LTELKKSYIDELLTSDPEDTAGREAAYHKNRAAVELQQMVENYGR
jgi:hypothetical protein